MNSVHEVRRIAQCYGGHCPWSKDCHRFNSAAPVSVFDTRNFKLDEQGRWTYYCAMYEPGKGIGK